MPYVKAFEEKWNSDRIYFQLKFRKRENFLWGRTTQNKNRILNCILNCCTAEKKSMSARDSHYVGHFRTVVSTFAGLCISTINGSENFSLLFNKKLGKWPRLRLGHLWFWIISVIICWKPIGWTLVWICLEIVSCHWAGKSLCEQRQWEKLSSYFLYLRYTIGCDTGSWN